MDRRTVLERLDAVRPSSDDLSLPELAEALAALRDDPEIAEEFESRGRFDARIATAIRDVPLPNGLQSRLLERLSAESPPQTNAVAPRRPEPGRMNRRSLFALAGALAASVIVGGVYWSMTMDSTAPLPVADVSEAGARLLTGSIDRVPFEGAFEPQFPMSGRWNRLRFDRAVYGLLPSDKGHRAAAWRFSYGTGNRSHGVLIAIPRESIAVPPDRDRDYVGGSTVAWTEGEFVYVCRVDGQIDRLLRQINDARLA